MNASMLQFLFRLAKALAAQFGPNCEIVIHDLHSHDPESSIVAIENGHVSGRKALPRSCWRLWLTAQLPTTV